MPALAQPRQTQDQPARPMTPRDWAQHRRLVYGASPRTSAQVAGLIELSDSMTDCMGEAAWGNRTSYLLALALGEVSQGIPNLLDRVSN